MCCTRLAGNTGRKNVSKIAIWAPSRNFVGSIFAAKARIDNRKKVFKQQYLPHMFSQYGKLRTTRLRAVSEFGASLQIFTARHSSSGRQPNFAALNRGRHLHSAGRPSRWALTHISSSPSNNRPIICASACEATVLWRFTAD